MIRSFVIFMIIILGIKSSQNKQTDLCEELSEMMENDQKFRKQLGLQNDTFLQVFDSLKRNHNITKDEFSNLTPEEQNSFLTNARRIASKQSKFSQKEKDSVWQLQIEIDRYNTKRLMKIVKNKGWVSKQNLGCQENLKTWIFFRHAPKEYFTQIRKIIDLEKEENRISEYEYQVIDNHLKGRPQMFKVQE